MTTLYKYNKFSFILLLIFWLIAGIQIFTEEKGALVLLLNSNRTPLLDTFFIYATKLAEPIVCVFFCVLWIIKEYKKGIFISSALILNTILVQFLKRVVFSDYKRPIHALGEQLNLIKDLDVHSNFSFPSGHTMAGFTLFFVLSLFSKNILVKLALILLAIIVGMSRVYLSQHYLMDVVAGSFLAVSMSILYYYIYNKTRLKLI